MEAGGVVDYGEMPFRYVVVDGSNIATEGRSLPSLAQLDEAVQEFQGEFSHVEVTVVVDASFGHRIDESERAVFEGAEEHGEVVSPPAGAIGRGDAFLLRIAEKMGATVLSNDSFQEFHGEHEWLFEPDRLIGGKPVPGVGWIFTPRTPVRGPKSRVAVKDARRTRVRIGSKEASQPMPVPVAPPPRPQEAATAVSRVLAVAQEVASEVEALTSEAATSEAAASEAAASEAGRAAPATEPASTGGRRPRGEGSGGRGRARARRAIEVATEEVVAPDSSSAQRRRRRRGAEPPPHAVNEPLAFITFIAEHPLGSHVEGEVDSFTSHGAFISVGGVQAYVPLSALGDPPPRSAREVLSKGEIRIFVLQALDPPRRGLELALPEYAHIAGLPSEETVEAEISGISDEEPPPVEPAKKATRARKTTKTTKATKATKATKTTKAPAEVTEAAAQPEASVEEPPPVKATKGAKKATRARKTTKTTKAPAEVTEAAAQPEAPEAAVEEPPPAKATKAAKKATRARKTTKTTKAPAEVVEGAPQTEAPTPQPEPSPIKATRARKVTRARKTTKAPAPEMVETSAQPEAPAPEPRQTKAVKATRTRKAKAPAPEMVETPAQTEAPAPEPQPAKATKKATRSRKVAKAPAPEDVDIAVKAAEVTTRTRKATKSNIKPSEKAAPERQ